MVKEIAKDNKEVYECEECRLLFEDETWAKKCEEWDKKYHACSLEITRHAIK